MRSQKLLLTKILFIITLPMLGLSQVNGVGWLQEHKLCSVSCNLVLLY